MAGNTGQLTPSAIPHQHVAGARRCHIIDSKHKSKNHPKEDIPEKKPHLEAQSFQADASSATPRCVYAAMT
eukprot:1160140-Pelagomonas_calceolata.AAC.1